MNLKDEFLSVGWFGFASQKLYRNVSQATSRWDLESALRNYTTENPYTHMSSSLSEDFIGWGRRFKYACQRFKSAKIFGVVHLATANPMALIDAFKAAAGVREGQELMLDEPTFLKCIQHDYYILKDQSVFIDLDKISVVGSAFRSGKLPWGAHFKM